MAHRVFYQTERLELKVTTERDADFVLELLNTPKWIRFIGDRNVHSLEDAKSYIAERMTPQQERLGFSNYTVILKDGGQKIGTCGLFDREGLEGIDIGFAFLPEYEGRGYAYEAAMKIKELAFEEFGLDLIRAITDKENKASQKLIEKLGLKPDGTICLPDDSEELLVYTLSKK